MRKPHETDFYLPLPDVGQFRYARRTFGDRLEIRREYLGLVREFGDSDPDLSMFASLISTHRVLCVEAPEGWEDLALLDLTAPNNPFEKAIELFGLLKDKEDSLAKGVEKSGEGEGSGTGGDDLLPVPDALQPAADGPTVPVDDGGGHAG